MAVLRTHARADGRAPCPFCSVEHYTRNGVWLFDRHARPFPRLGLCPGSLALLPLPNLWTTLEALATIRKDHPTVLLKISREALAVHVVPGDVILHPTDGEPFAIEATGLNLARTVELKGRHHPRTSRLVKLQLGPSDRLEVLPDDPQADAVWSSILDAIERAVKFWEGVTAEPATEARERVTQAVQAAPWSVIGEGLSVQAQGHEWLVTARQPLPAVAEPDPEG